MSALEVLWRPQDLATRPAEGRLLVVVDAIRATTSITVALAQGAARVIPAASVDAARRIHARHRGALLCGERGGLPPPGFDLGNSPAGFTPEAVAGRVLVFTTTNGTAAIEAATGARRLWLGCFRNLTAVARVVTSERCRAPTRGAPITVLCSGRRGRHSMDDAWCAGHLVERMMEVEPGLTLGNGATAALALARDAGAPTPAALARTEAGHALRALGLEGDLGACAAVDDVTVVPTWRDGAFVKGGEEAGDGR